MNVGKYVLRFLLILFVLYVFFYVWGAFKGALIV